MQSWISLLISALVGGLGATIVNIGWSWWNAKRAADARQEGIIASLAGELRRTIALCNRNAGLREDPLGPFIRFPTAVALRVTFEERHSYPRLVGLQKDLEAYTMSVIHVNQLIDLHELLWSSPESGKVSVSGQVLRTELQVRIARLCAGERKIEGVGPENFIYLPEFTEHVLHEIERLMRT